MEIQILPGFRLLKFAAQFNLNADCLNQNSWTDMITKKMEAEARRAAEHKHETATGETEFWSQR